MLWQLVVSPPVNTPPTAHSWCVRRGVAGAAEARAIAARLARGLARLRHQRERFGPDKYATEAPFMSDR